MEFEFYDYIALRSTRQRLAPWQCFIYNLVLAYFSIECIKGWSKEIVITELVLFVVLYFLRTFDKDGASKLLFQLTFLILTIFVLNNKMDAVILGAYFSTRYIIFENYFIWILRKIGFGFLYVKICQKTFGTLPSSWFVFIYLGLMLHYYIGSHHKSREDAILGASVLWTVCCCWTGSWNYSNVFVNSLFIFAWAHLKSKRFGRIIALMEPHWDLLP